MTDRRRLATVDVIEDAARGTTFEDLDEGRYRLSVPAQSLHLEVDHLRRERHELLGELAVSCGIAGAKTFDSHLSIGSFNLSSPRARLERARLLADRARCNELDFGDLLEELCQRVLLAERRGNPSVNLRDVPCPDRSVADWSVGGFWLPRRHPSIAFADGGSLKSYVALWLLGQLAQRDGLRVGLFDWELDSPDHRVRLAELFGEDNLPDVTYARCDRPLVFEVDRLLRIARQERLDYAVFDSVAFACDGPPEAAETAAAYFRAVRQIGVGSLHLAHITKAGEDNDKKPFGSIFWANSARATWFIKKAPEAGARSPEVDLGVIPRKANLGPLRPAFGLRATFAGGRVQIAPIDVATIDDLAAKLPIWQRTRAALREGPQQIHAIAKAIEADPKSVEKALMRGEGKWFIRRPGPSGVFEWANVDPRVA
jgi:hypothetical protein